MSRNPSASTRTLATLTRLRSTGLAVARDLTAESPGDEPVLVETDPRALVRRLGRPAVWGLLACLAITYGAAQQGSPFTLKLGGAWFFGVPSITTPPGREMLLALVASYGGMFLLLRAWFDLVHAVSPSHDSTRRAVPVGALAVIAVVWLIPMLVVPPLFSQDVYSYAAQGQMVTQGIDPYTHGPDALGPNSPYYPLVDQLWGAAPAPYGPVFMAADAAINNVTGHHVLGAVVGLRLLSLLGVALMAVFLPVIARSMRRDPGAVFALAVLNPVTLLHLVAGAHNDALMLGLLVAGVALALRKRPVWAVVLCTLAAAVKVPAALGIVYVGWHWLGPRAGWRERIRPLATSGMLAAAIVAVITAVTGLGWGWAKALDNPSVVRSATDPMTALGMGLGSVTHFLHLGVGVTGMLHVTRTLGLLAAVAAGVWLLLNSDRIGMVKALGLTMLAVVVLGPVVQPWYLAWGIVMLAPVATNGRWRTLVMGTTLVGSLIGFPGGWQLLDQLGRASVGTTLLALGVLLAVITPPLLTPVRRLLAGRAAAPASV